ncbi:hypothetical protein ACA910_012868 [Epithemia clementina (nom. ined.)]
MTIQGKIGESSAKNVQTTESLSSKSKRLEPGKNTATAQQAETSTADEHLPPIILLFTVLLCSGFILMFALRDYMMTGRNIFGTMDEAYLIFTKSTDWYDDSKGWKSTQGGFSAIQPASTDKNDMGGLFVRKLAGAAVAGVQLQKILPLLFQPTGAQWNQGHYRPLLFASVFANLVVVSFLAYSRDDLSAGGATELPQLWMGALLLESSVMNFMLFAMMRKTPTRSRAIAMQHGKTPSSPPSRIVSRTVLIVSSAVAIVAGRDFFLPGMILDFFPSDDIYLEWTNAFHHSPPEGSPEYSENVLQSALFVGDKFISQYAALHLLLLCLFKLISAVGIRYGADGRGEIQARMIWTAQTLSNGMLLFMFRLFASAAGTASLDLRWHLVAIAYETFILGLYGFFYIK